MRHWTRRGLCLLAALVLLTGAVCAAGPEKVHQPVDFADMVCTPFDETALTEALDQLEALCGPDFREEDQARALYETILEEYDRLYTLHALAYVHYCASGAAQEWADAEGTLLDQATQLQDRVFAVLRQLADSPCRSVLDDALGEEYTEALLEYEDMSDTLRGLLQEENQLVQRYEQTVSRGVEAVVDGQTWTDEALAAADLRTEDYLRISDRLDEALNRAVGETFRQLIQVRTAIAQEEGCDSYADYAYACYNRDYSPRDVRRLRQAVKQYFLPLDDIRYDACDEAALRDAFQALDIEGASLMQALQPGIAAIHPDLQDSFDFMMQHQLYDTDPRPEKLGVGFTTNLNAYGSAYIFNSPYGTYQDCSDMVHEFGHFHQSFCDPTPALWLSSNMDTAEIHSQALQLLFAGSSDLFGAASGDFFYAVLNELVDSIQEGCMYDEFLAEVYSDPTLSLAEINARFKDISEAYGYYYPEGQEESWFWARVPHNFQSPFYYISYAVSALSSLDLWLRSQEDWNGAVETYMDLSALSQDVPFRAALKEAELADIFDRAAVREIAEETEHVFLGEEVRYQPPAGSSLRSLIPQIAYLIGYLLIPAAVLLVVFLAVRLFFRRRRRRRQVQYIGDQYRRS